MTKIEITINPANALETMAIQNALQQIATSFNKKNLVYIADLSRKPGVNEKFEKLQNNPLVKSLL